MIRPLPYGDARSRRLGSPRKAVVCPRRAVTRRMVGPEAPQHVTYTVTFSPKVADRVSHPAARSLPRPVRPARASPLFP
jgi:hypothetical protein